MIRRDQFGRKITPAESGAADPTSDAADLQQNASPTTPTDGPGTADPKSEQPPAAGRHRFEVSGGPDGAGPSNAAVKVLKILGLCVVAAVLAQAGWFLTHRPDPHYLRAEKLVNDYEIGRPEEQRNYAHTIYRQALEELAQVDRGSVSADAAEALMRRIEMDMQEFEERRELEQKARSAAADKRAQREKAVIAARQWAKDHWMAEEDYKSACDHPEED